MERTIEVTIEVRRDGLVDLTFYEPECGDCEVYCRVEMDEVKQIAGCEISSWVGLMLDDMEEEEEEEDE